MIDIIISSYREPKATLRAVKSFLRQKIKEEFKIIVVDPFSETEEFLEKNLNSRNVEFFLDPGEGKSYALNLLFQEHGSSNTNDIFILTDGDVYVSDNVLEEILKKFKDPKIGCVTGKPVSINPKNTKYGYWSNLFFEGIHRARSELSKQGKFFECSGYLFAIRKGVLFDFPLGACEDAIISHLFWKKGYKIAYAEKAEVYVKNPSNWEDWTNQKIRNIKGHENLNRLISGAPRTKSFFNEIRWGAFFALFYPKNLKEFFWNIEAYFARLYIYFKAFSEINSNKIYADGWRVKETPTTRTLD
ncbi:MAG: glycosyltransferase family 2 protein [Nanoarchaeota archaeon]|nr:glycosyltransferase family 2 protein [Nanoarchaeota archaeon]MBU1104000.1 glycosyltransferase family 2 protein [Nanoarchaeota archaeon]